MKLGRLPHVGEHLLSLLRLAFRSGFLFDLFVLGGFFELHTLAHAGNLLFVRVEIPVHKY